MIASSSRIAADQQPSRSFGEFVLLIFSWSVVAWLIWHIVQAHATSQWDLAVYRRAGAAFNAGRNPYRTASGELPFVYPPIALPLCALLAKLVGPAAYTAWLLAKAGCLVIWLRVAARHFEPFVHHWSSVLFLVFAFNGTLYTDIVAGNVTVFVEVVLWLGFAALLRRRYTIASVLIVIASQLKLSPSALLVLLLIVPERPRWGAFAAGVALMLGSLGAQYVLWPEAFVHFVTQLRELGEAGHLNPNTYTVASEIGKLLAAMDPIWIHSAPWLYGLGASAILVWAVHAVIVARRFYREHPAWLIAFALCVDALILPRFKDYAYIRMLIPAWMALKRVDLGRRWAWLPALVVLPQNQTFLPMGPWVARISEYAPWMATTWLAATISSHSKRGTVRAPASG